MVKKNINQNCNCDSVISYSIFLSIIAEIELNKQENKNNKTNFIDFYLPILLSDKVLDKNNPNNTTNIPINILKVIISFKNITLNNTENTIRDNLVIPYNPKSIFIITYVFKSHEITIIIDFKKIIKRYIIFKSNTFSLKINTIINEIKEK